MPGLPAAVKAAADAADDVDRKSRFLSEAIDLLKDARLLSCSLPTDPGGRSYGIAELAVIARALGGACSSAGMVFAMHHAQALSLAQHAHEGQIARLTSRIAADESLLALATNEITTGGGPDEHIFPDTPRRPIHHLRPIPAAALPGERLYRIVMSMRAAGRAMSGQRKRVDHRPGARLQVEVVEPAQHRLGMRHGRRRLPATANCLAGHRVHARLVARPRYGGTITVWAPPVWPDRLVRDL